MKHSTLLDPITIDQPMVLIPADEYETLLHEAGLLPTPELDKRIAAARKNFKNKKFIAWNDVKHVI
jgi:PHD/YefM family antitoxin component YafN of YafNO toxin-antitoxin module